jgi:hypothetical protein
LKKSQKKPKKDVLLRTSRNWCTDPMHVIHHVHRRQLQQISAQQSTKISKKLKKSQKKPKSDVLSRTSRNWCTDPMHVIHHKHRLQL